MFKNLTIFSQIVISFAIALLPLIMLTYLSYSNSKELIEKNTLKSLEAIAKEKAFKIQSYAKNIKRDIKGLAKSIELFALSKEMNTLKCKNLNQLKELDEYFKRYLNEAKYYDLFLIDIDGDILYSVTKESDLGTNLKDGIYSSSSLAKVFENSISTLDSEISNFEYYEPSKKYASFIAYPLFFKSKLIGSVALQINNDKLHSIVNDYSNLGKNGEIVTAVKNREDVIFTTPLRHNPELLYKSVNREVDIPILRAIEGDNSSAKGVDYRGVEILATWRYIPDFNWGMVVKVDLDEIYLELNRYESFIVFLFILTMIISLTLIYLLSKSITEPIIKLKNSALAFSRGNFSKKALIYTKNEIGELAKTLNSMGSEIDRNILKLKTQATQLEEQNQEIEEFSKSLERKVEQKTKELKRYIDIIDENVITSTTDLSGKIIYASEAFSKISGYSKDELIGKNHRVIRDPDMKSEIYRKLWKTIQSGQSWRGELKNRRKNGTSYWVDSVITPNFNSNGDIISYTAIRQDITDKKRIEEIATVDDLTKLHNRRYFNDIFPKEIHRTQRESNYLSFLIIDVDNFKKYNDTYGHQAGDDVLKSIGRVFKEKLHRGSDFSFRLGGEEFGALFSSLDREKSLEFANSIRRAIEELKIEHRENPPRVVTASMGLITLNSTHQFSENDIYKFADESLYEAKESGRNRVILNPVED